MKVSIPKKSDQIKTDNSVTDLIKPDIVKHEIIPGELTQKENDFAIAASKLITNLLHYQKTSGVGKLKSSEQFARAYNNGALGSFPEIFKIIGKRSARTLRAWRDAYIKSGKDYRALARNYKTKKSLSIPPEQAKVLLQLHLTPNQPLINETVRNAIDIFKVARVPNIRHEKTYKRFLERWEKENYAEYVFMRKGEQGLDNEVLPYNERDWERIEVGYMLVMDGHVDNYETLNPFPNKKGVITGKPKRMMTVGAIDARSQYLCGYEKAPTENIQAIAVALFRAILNLGKIPKIIYFDNGKAFGAKYFHGDEFDNLIPLFERLGITVIFAKPYHGQSKPIEPFWKWMGELERLMPTYVGTSIQLQPPRLNRGEKLHRKLYEKAMQNTTVDIYTAHRAMAWWLDKYHNRKKVSGHLKGKTPAEVFNAGRGPGIDKNELTFLMMDHKIVKIYRKGIRMFNAWYWHEELFGKKIDETDEVHVKYDLMFHDSIFVYDKHGDLICEARKVEKVHPAAMILGTEEEQKEFKQQLQTKERLKKSVVGESRAFLKNEIYPAIDKRLKEAKIIEIQNAPANPDSSTPEQKPVRKKRSIVDRWKLPDEYNDLTKKAGSQ